MLETLDIVFRTLTLMAIAVLAALLLTVMRRRTTALPGALFCGAVAAFFVTSHAGSGELLGSWAYPLTALCVTKAVWFWVFARTLFNDGSRLGARDVLIAAAIALWGTWQQKVFLPEYRLGVADVWEIGAGFGFDVVLRELEEALETERIFLQEGLTIGALAARLGTGEPVLRRVINRGMGYRNFNDFLHAFRIREACEALSRPDQACVPVLSIAMDVGYGSIGAFNRAFKSRIGMTPTDFRRRMSSSR